MRPLHSCLLWIVVFGAASTLDADDDIRQTATVQILERVQPTVAVIYAYSKEGQSLGVGSGSVIDPRGYVLTAKHVVGDRNIVLLGGRSPLTASLVGSSHEFDVAILRLGKPAFQRAGSPTFPRDRLPPDFIRLGVDAELQMGESILNVGSPGGRGIVASKGIVSAVAFTGINPLSIALQSSMAFDEMIQFDAASNPGNSGGPLINMLGQQVGMVVSGIHSEEGIHFALPTKTIRHCIVEILCSEMRRRYATGITVDQQLAATVITKIDPESAASAVGLQIGDQIQSIGGRPIRDPVDWAFTQAELSAHQTISLAVQRDRELVDVQLELAPRTRQIAVESKSTEPGLRYRYATYDPRLPNPIDDEDRPSGPARSTAVVDARPAGVQPEDHYELVIEGLLNVDKAGRYCLGLRSDDGSCLYIHDKLVVNNNGNHAPLLRTGWVDLEAGYHPLRVEYYEDEGGEVLELLVAFEDNPLQAVSAESLFHEAPPSATQPTDVKTD